MDSCLSRKRFLITGGIAVVGTLLGRAAVEAQASAAPSASPVNPDAVPDFPEHDPQLERARVKRFVIAAHFNLAAVQKMLAEDANLINGTIDWGAGDFESALGGAAHMGRRDIAELLLERGARLDVFTAAMLGQLEVVKAAVAAFPNIVHVPGPHKIPLITHAEKGGPAATPVVEFLRPLLRSL